MPNDIITSKVHELRELKHMQEELNAQIEAIQDDIKAAMTEQNTDTINGTDFKVTWKECQSSRFDSKGFKAKYGELYNAFLITSTTRRFMVA